ncbi:hypothetical protein PACILC2_24320 [Paenibacillus cisolokensis]|jgi:Response regulator containing a CheY-like receiver domain and an HTH DNA-binding domain|uniref:HTH luxR-type domain-containing protein n=1 Tax=Paenibacillus cisolokensis TaxID=1658519 RepID=A0ABQ4N6L9_9BACL|nr:hypothetical protein PACILC2_24320 [Paenibacillus cisolokensis]
MEGDQARGSGLFLQREILQCLESGHSVSDMNKMLFLSPFTIRNYISEIYAKTRSRQSDRSDYDRKGKGLDRPKT